MVETLRIAVRVFIPPGQRLKWVGLTFLALAVAAAETVTAYLIFRVLGFATAADTATSSDPVELAFGVEIDIVPLLFIAGGAFVLRGFLALFNTYAQARVVQSAGASVAARIHRRYMLSPYQFHLTRSSAESVRTVIWSVDAATMSGLAPIVSIITQSLITAALVALLISIAPLLSLGAVVVLGVGLGLILLLVQPALGRLGRMTEETMTSLLQSVRDSFDSIRDIKAYRAEHYFDMRFKRYRLTLARIRRTRAVLDQVPGTSLEFIVVIGLLAVIGLSVSGDSFDSFIPVLGAFGYATLRITPSLTKVVASVNRLKFGQQAMRNVDKDLHSTGPTSAPLRADDDRQPGRLFENDITLRGITFTYPESDRKAVNAVDLDIHRGETLAIAGASGSGKSTLVDIVLGLLDPDEGGFLIDGSERLRSDWHRHIGVVSQSVVLLDASLRENVAFGAGRGADDERIMGALERAQLGEWTRSLPQGLDTMVGEAGKLLSGGERQRVAIARSLYRHPDLLILDEATSALDGATEASLIESLGSLSDILTTVIVSHRIAPIRAADRVVMMDGGRVTDVGTFDDLVARPGEFRDLVGLASEPAAP